MRLRFVVYVVIGCTFLAGCARQPEVIVLAPTSTLQGAVVPTRIATEAASLPTETPNETPSVPTVEALTASETLTAVSEIVNRTIPSTLIAIQVTNALPSPFPTEQLTNTSEPSHTPQPTDTPIPSATPVPPTATPLPTDIPSATFTATDLPSDTPTPTALPPTNTPEPPTSTPEPPSNTPTVPPVTPTVPPVTPTVPPITPTAVSFTTQGLPYLNSTALVPVTLEALISAGSPVSGSIRDGSPAILYPFQGTSGDIINVLMETTDSTSDYPLIPRVSVIDPKGREIARSLDEHGEGQALISGLSLSESGTFIIVASRQDGMFGLSEGGFVLEIAQVDAGEPQNGIVLSQIPYDFPQRQALTDSNPVRAFTFLGRGGDVISIEMYAESPDLDPQVMLTDNLGNPLVANDDDHEQGTYDSLIADYMLPASGYYTVVADSFADTRGEFELVVSLHSQGSGEPEYLDIPLDIVNSLSVRADGQFYSGYTAGDIIDNDKNELRIAALLSFFLPPLPDGSIVEDAFLSLTPCLEGGQGFTQLGDLSVMLDPYGEIYSYTQDVTRISPGALEIALQDGCDSVDLTDYVADAYNNGRSAIQLRLWFRNPSTNGATDYINFTPRLTITPAE